MWEYVYVCGMSINNTKRDEIYESVKLERRVVEKVRKYIKKTKQTIGGVFSLAVEEYLKSNKK